MKRTTIVATLGPATSDSNSIEKLVRAGMSVARINFSHGAHEEHRERVNRVRAISNRLGTPVACLQDLCGPKIRTGPMSRPEGVTLIDGAEFTLTTERVEGTQTSVSTTYPKLAREVTPGEKILLDDGSLSPRPKCSNQ
jgi:pyruvate kinase